MRIHFGRKVAALGLAAAVVGGVAGTALAASGSSTAAKPTVEPAAAVVATKAAQPQLVKMTMTQLTEKLGVNEKEMIVALDDMKNTVITSGKLTQVQAENIMVKILASDLQISGAAATWAVEEINGGYVPTYVNWGFPTK
jgi:hypothetical protein